LNPWRLLLRPVAALARILNRAQGAALDALERVTLRSALARRFLVATHRAAAAALLRDADLGELRNVVVIGGGLFPRSVLAIGDLLPRAHFVVIDRSAAHLAEADAWLAPALRERVSWSWGSFDAGAVAGRCDLLIVPLGFRGDRPRLYAHPPAPAVLIHDWLWRRRGAAGIRVSGLLLKRLNLVKGARDVASRRPHPATRAAHPRRSPARPPSSRGGEQDSLCSGSAVSPWPHPTEIDPPRWRPTSSNVSATATRRPS